MQSLLCWAGWRSSPSCSAGWTALPWGVCLDTNVMSTWGDSIPRWFERLGEHTGLVRLCDGNYHGWRAWGEGVLPMERYRAELEAAGYAGPVSLLLPGERYAGRPSWPEERALEVLRGGAE